MNGNVSTVDMLERYAEREGQRQQEGSLVRGWVNHEAHDLVTRHNQRHAANIAALTPELREQRANALRRSGD